MHGCKDTVHTKIVCYIAWNDRLHPMAAHPGKVTNGINKVSYNMQKCDIQVNEDNLVHVPMSLRARTSAPDGWL